MILMEKKIVKKQEISHESLKMFLKIEIHFYFHDIIHCF
jgi:hypothetical protein